MRLQLCDGIKEFWQHQRTVLIFAAALIFLHRPIMSAGSFSWAGITFFTEGLYVLLALGFLLLRPTELRRTLLRSSYGVKIPFLVILLSGLIHWVLGGFYHPEYLGLALAWSILPLFGAVYRKDLEKILPGTLAIFWIWNVLNCIYTESFSTSMFGITGNWNWSAILLLVSTPFAILYLPKDWKYRKAAIGAISVITLVLLYFLQSRAVVLSAAGTAVFFFFLKFRKLRIPMIVSGIVLLVLAAVLAFRVFPERTEAFLGREIRVEIWKSTIALLKDSPLGVGAATFENAFIPYKSVSYFLNDHAAIRSTHPHNEFLYLAAALGIPALLAMLCWGFFLLKNAVREFDSGKMTRERKIFLLILFCSTLNGMLDLTFHVWPTGILLFLLIGMFVFPAEETEPMAEAETPARKIGLTVSALVILLAILNFLGTFCWEVSHSAVLRKDYITAKHYASAGCRLGNSFPNLLYRGANEAVLYDRTFSLELANALQQTPWKDFAHIHGLKAQNFAMMKRDADAIPEYLLDIQCYPVHILPHIGLMMSYGRLGQIETANLIRQEVAALIKLRKLSPSDVQAIMKNPEYDLQPHLIKRDNSNHLRWGFYYGKQ